MSEMIERVARAICTASGRNPDAIEQWMTNPPKPTGWLGWMAYQTQARDAIFAMREPTEPMLNAPDTFRADALAGHFDILTNKHYREIFVQMIDAALT